MSDVRHPDAGGLSVAGKQHAFDEVFCQSVEPFAGDETDVSLLSDKIVRAAKAHSPCQICRGGIFKGERHRARTERNNEDRKIMTFRFCSKCCRAMAIAEDYSVERDWSDAERPIESRYRIGERRAALARTQSGDKEQRP